MNKLIVIITLIIGLTVLLFLSVGLTELKPRKIEKQTIEIIKFEEIEYNNTVRDKEEVDIKRKVIDDMNLDSDLPDLNVEIPEIPPSQDFKLPKW